MKVRIATTILALCLVGGSTGGCHVSAPSFPEENEIVDAVREEIPEEIELVEQIDDDTYLFRSCVRDLEFEVNVKADTYTIDGEPFGYTGGYSYPNNYDVKVYGLYKERIEKLIADHGFEIYETSFENIQDMPCINEFTIGANENLDTPEIENINDFLYCLREIAREEQQYRNDDENKFKFCVYFHWAQKWNGRENLFIRLKGNDGWRIQLTDDSSDEELDVRNYECDGSPATILRPDDYGVLIYIDFDPDAVEETDLWDEYDDFEDASGNPDEATAYCMTDPNAPDAAMIDPGEEETALTGSEDGPD